MPPEDTYRVKGNIFCVADGITRDPLGITDFSGHSMEEILRSYPNPSPAALAANKVCESFVEYLSNTPISDDAAKQAMIVANKKVVEINQGKTIDYLIHDYAGCVAAGGVIKDKELYWASITDCQISVFDGNNKEKFTTPNGFKAWADYEKGHQGDWNKAEYRKLVRSQYRNNPDMVENGICISYGALTGEETAEAFIVIGKLTLADSDTVVCNTDGFTPMVSQPDFLKALKQSRAAFDRLDRELANQDPNKYGKERTMIVLTEF